MITHENGDWPALREWLLKQIEEERAALEEIGIMPNIADAHRGAIAAHRKLINAVDPAVIIHASQIEDSSEEPPIYHEA